MGHVTALRPLLCSLLLLNGMDQNTSHGLQRLAQPVTGLYGLHKYHQP